MVCAVICSFIAWYIEVRSSTKALVPQFSLLGMTQGFVKGGLTEFIPRPRSEFDVGSFSELAIGSGKLLIIPIVFSSWIEDTVDASHLDRFYLMLGILNAVFLLSFLYYSITYAYKEEYPQDEKVTVEHTLEHGHQPDPEYSPALGNNSETQQVEQVREKRKGCSTSSLIKKLQMALSLPKSWQVEVRRLSQEANRSVALVPQFILLGMAEGLVDGGFMNLFYGHVAKSMWDFADSFSELVTGTGKLLVTPFILIFSSWFNGYYDTSHLDSYFLMLGIVNAAFLLVFAYYSIRYAYKEVCPEDEKVTMEQILEH
ncbi:Protein NRT1/ PTR FAMILY 5.7, partial [Mucuna pruriens]